jgi:hypothetical protein
VGMPLKRIVEPQLLLFLSLPGLAVSHFPLPSTSCSDVFLATGLKATGPIED